MSETVTYIHEKVGTQSAAAGSPLALALEADEGWSREGEAEATEEPGGSEEHQLESRERDELVAVAREAGVEKPEELGDAELIEAVRQAQG